MNLVAVHGRRFIDELRSSVARDIESFRSEFSGDRAREIVFDSANPNALSEYLLIPVFTGRAR